MSWNVNFTFPKTTIALEICSSMAQKVPWLALKNVKDFIESTLKPEKFMDLPLLSI